MALGGEWVRQLQQEEPAARAARFTCWYSNCDNIVFPAGTAMLPGADNRLVEGVAHMQMAFHPMVVQAWEPSYQGRSFTLGVSIGLVVLDASLQDVPSVLYAADMACYDAKRAGRNRVETRHADQAAASGRMALGPV